MSKRSSLYDRQESFGWLSIALHWLTAAVIIALRFIGKSISSQELDAMDARRTLHITIGLTAWVLLLVRIVWRFAVGHPHARGQTERIHRFARAVHYAMLLILSIILVSGPLLAWLLPGRTGFAAIVHTAHAGAATVLATLVLVHILGSLKHLMFHDDETIVRMFWPRPSQTTNSRQPNA